MASDFDFTKVFAELKLPAMPDLETLLAANRKNLDVLAQASRVAMEGAQAIARRQWEIMQNSGMEITTAMQTLAMIQSPQAKAAKQAELLKQAYERSVTQMKELSDLIQQSNGEALSLINRRFSEAMDEVKALADKAK